MKIMTVVFAFVQAVAMSACVGYLFCHVAKQRFFPENDPRASKLTLTRGFFENTFLHIYTFKYRYINVCMYAIYNNVIQSFRSVCKKQLYSTY